MRNVLEVSKAIGVTPQAIYKQIKEDSIKGLNGCLSKNDKNATVISEKGIELLKNHFKTDEKAGVNPLSVDLIHRLDAELKRAQVEIDRLRSDAESMREEYKEQLQRKDEQIAALIEQNSNSQQIIMAMQVTQHKRKLLNWFKPSQEDGN
jgi:Na+-translocating ferredoxin:NAD+ oxidoreductase RNF subunit RnfB